MAPCYTWYSIDPRTGCRVDYVANDALEHAYQDPSTTELPLTILGLPFRVVFSEMRQYNMTGQWRRVVREGPEGAKVTKAAKATAPAPAAKTKHAKATVKKVATHVKKAKAVKKRRAKPVRSYARYIHKLAKQQKGVQMSTKAMGIVDAFARDVFDRLAGEAARATRFAGVKTLRVGGIVAATKMHLPGDLATGALARGVVAARAFHKATSRRG